MSHLMEQRYQDVINRTCRPEIVRELQLDEEFFNEMRQDNCMTETMQEQVEIKMKNGGRMAGVSEFLTLLRSRPQRAFDRFRKTLQVTLQDHILEIIDSALEDRDIRAGRLDIIDSPKENNEMEEIVKTVDDATNDLKGTKIESMTALEKKRKDCYPFASGKQRVKVIIVNVKHLLHSNSRSFGSEKDVKILENLFNHLQYKVVIQEDGQAEGIENFLKEESKDLSNYDVLIIVLMSHGKHNAIFGSDEEPVYLFPDVVTKKVYNNETKVWEESKVHVPGVLSIFSPENCPAMAGKPKLFLIQACQVERREIEEEFQYPDALMAMATVPGTSAHRAAGGSWFIRALVLIIAKYSHRYDFETLLEKTRKIVGEVQKRVNERNQAKARARAQEGEPSNPNLGDAIQLSRTITSLGKMCYLFS